MPAASTSNLHLPKIYSITVSKPKEKKALSGVGNIGITLIETDDYGVQVKKIDRESPFKDSKLIPGMILLSVEGNPGISTIAQASHDLQEATSPVTIFAAKTFSSVPSHYIKLQTCNIFSDGIRTGSGHTMLGIRFAQVCSVLVRVSYLAENSPLIGQLKPGDIILSINGEAVSHPEHALRLVRSTSHSISNLGGTVVFQVWDIHNFIIEHVLIPAWTESFNTTTVENFQNSLRYDESWKEIYCTLDDSHRFVIDDEYLRVSHKEPWRYYKSNYGGKLSEGSKMTNFQSAVHKGNEKTRYFVKKLQQLVWQAELGELGAVVGNVGGGGGNRSISGVTSCSSPTLVKRGDGKNAKFVYDKRALEEEVDVSWLS